VVALSVDGEVLGKATYRFERVVPFYFSFWAILIYAVLCYLMIRQYINWRTRKIIRRNQHQAQEEMMRQNLKMLEQKQIIAAQQKIIMENELTTKSKELASMAFKVAVQKNKSDVLREELLEKKRKGVLTDKDFKDLITKSEGGDSEEVWDIFQQNFDLIHQNFFRKLRSRYPNLTPTDLKFCALLRLNLNTKEIAKHTNLTIRGVEGARYRLRKKLGIKNKQSLTEFLIDLK
jgi:DNA-binding CsgD family transcriptional regulator